MSNEESYKFLVDNKVTFIEIKKMTSNIYHEGNVRVELELNCDTNDIYNVILELKKLIKERG